jgi:serine/threonine-protein kinase PknK
MGLSGSDIAPSALPASANRFVGRSRELKQLAKLLTRARLVTLTGVGGAGKTRLALAAAQAVGGSVPDGVAFVSLADLQDGALLGQVIAGSLGLRGAGARWDVEALVQRLADSHRLLVLDNCEHLVGECAALLTVLLSACPRISVLTTSRESIAVDGEHIFPVLPLEVPALDAPLAALGQFDAVDLFVERATSVVPTFELTEANHRSVAALCRTLDGIPLALELAAVRLRGLSLAQIVQLLSERPDLLDGGRRGGHMRQRTLSASMSWSHDLCSVEEQLLWERLSVFAGGVELSAAEGVCSDSRLPAVAVLPLLTSLVDKSILIREEREGRVWYRLLETVRQFGLGRLGEDEVGEWRRRHRDWYLELVQRTMSDWRSPGHAERLQILRGDIANLRAALEFCADQPGESTAGLQMASSLYYYWLSTGLISEGTHWIDRLLTAVSDSEPERIRGLYVAASLASLRSDVTSADGYLRDALALCDLHDDAAGRAYAVQAQGLMALVMDDTDRASELLATAI